MDTSIYNVISNNIISDSLTPTVVFLTNIGGTVFLIVLTLILLLTIKNKKIGLCITINLALSALINFLFKNIVQRPRPDESIRLISESGFSFPSRTFHGKFIFLWFFNIFNL